MSKLTKAAEQLTQAGDKLNDAAKGIEQAARDFSLKTPLTFRETVTPSPDAATARVTNEDGTVLFEGQDQPCNSESDRC